MSHAEERLIGRIIERAGESRENAVALLNRARKMARESRVDSEAVLLAKVAFQGEAWSNESNGDHVWAIIRDSRLVTIMFRRSTQPATPEALRVDHVHA